MNKIMYILYGMIISNIGHILYFWLESWLEPERRVSFTELAVNSMVTTILFLIIFAAVIDFIKWIKR